MAHQFRADPLALVLVDHNEGHLGLPRLSDDVTRATDDHGSTGFFHHGHQGHMIDEVDVHEECDLLLCKATLCCKEPSEERLGAGAADSHEEAGLVIRPEGAYLDPAPVAQRLNTGIRGRIWHKG